MNPIFLALLAIAAGGPVVVPEVREPEPPRLPPDVDAEDELLRFIAEPPEDVPDHKIETAIRLARKQARDIDAYLVRHTSPRGADLRRHRLELLDVADRWARDLRIEQRVRIERARASFVEWGRAAQNASARVEAAMQQVSERVPAEVKASKTIFIKPPPTIARRVGDFVIETPIPLVRCPRTYCLAAPGRRCRGRSGEAMDTPHPERVRASQRKAAR